MLTDMCYYFLRYIYTDNIEVRTVNVNRYLLLLFKVNLDNIEVTADNVNGLMYASEKYMLDGIKNECKKLLTTNINDDNVCMVLQTAHNLRRCPTIYNCSWTILP